MHYLGPHYFVGLFQLVCGRWGSVRPVAVKEFISALSRDLRLKAGLQVKFVTCLDIYYKLFYLAIPWTASRPSHDCCRSSFFKFSFSPSTVTGRWKLVPNGGSWFQTVEVGSVPNATGRCALLFLKTVKNERGHRY